MMLKTENNFDDLVDAYAFDLALRGVERFRYFDNLESSQQQELLSAFEASLSTEQLEELAVDADCLLQQEHNLRTASLLITGQLSYQYLKLLRKYFEDQMEICIENKLDELYQNHRWKIENDPTYLEVA